MASNVSKTNHLSRRQFLFISNAANPWIRACSCHSGTPSFVLGSSTNSADAPCQVSNDKLDGEIGTEKVVAHLSRQHKKQSITLTALSHLTCAVPFRLHDWQLIHQARRVTMGKFQLPGRARQHPASYRLYCCQHPHLKATARCSSKEVHPSRILAIQAADVDGIEAWTTVSGYFGKHLYSASSMSSDARPARQTRMVSWVSTPEQSGVHLSHSLLSLGAGGGGGGEFMRRIQFSRKTSWKGFTSG